MEENKKCCEKSECESCNTCCSTSKCCMWKKCKMMKYLFLAIIIIIIFSLGSEWGEMKASVKGPHFEGRMMNWDSERFENRFDKNLLKTTDSATVEIQIPPKQ